jgi:hypothetical protein
MTSCYPEIEDESPTFDEIAHALAEITTLGHAVRAQAPSGTDEGI